MRSSMKLGIYAWAALVALGCGGEPAVHTEDAETTVPDLEVTDTTLSDTTEVLDTVSPDTAEVTDTVAEVTDTTLPDTVAEVTDATLLDTTEVLDTTPPDTMSPDTTEVPDTTSPDTIEVTDTTSPDTTEVTDTVAEVTDTTPDTQTPDTYTPLCDAVTTTYPVIPSPYVPVCSALTFATDPPTSGPHYPVWATYKTYGVPVNPGFLVHSLKHGAIVITWRCPDGCLDDLVELREMLNRRPADRMCDPLLKHRIIVAPRPDQDAMLVASAWGASWKAPCFDLVALEAFIDARYGQGLENECFDGVDVEKVRPDNAWYCPP